MSKGDNIEKYLPLSESTFCIMLMLVQPMHGYAVMQEVERLSEGAITIGAGTLYGAFSTLEQERLIEMAGKEGRRKSYVLTEKGQRVLALQQQRLDLITRMGEQVLKTQPTSTDY
ncbi:MAG: helix-turn-helix transcriptional regulator [Anaerolineae bacterium]|nr:helix-turn-helix transcriptional regulator [Anaerolineae bacterium]